MGFPDPGWLGCCFRLGNDESLRHIAMMPRLRMLSCEDVVDAVAYRPRLRKVSLGSLPNVTREGAASFPAHVRVSYL